MTSIHRGSGRIKKAALARQWAPPPLPPHIEHPEPVDVYPEPYQANGQLAPRQSQQAGQITPAQFVGGLERLHEAMQANAAALQQHQAALAQFQTEQQAAIARYQQPNYPPAHYAPPYPNHQQASQPVQPWQRHQQIQPWQQHQPQYQQPIQPWQRHQQIQPWQQYQSNQPWYPPNQQAIAFNPTISPHININIDAKSHSEQDNDGGSWWLAVLLVLLFVVFPVSVAISGPGD